jgi:superfamily II DNA or RNA helicase
MIEIIKINELFIKVISDRDIALEIYDNFSFFVPGYKHMPRYKNGIWDGQIHLFNLRTRHFPIGLLADLVRYFRHNEYEFTVDRFLKLQGFDESLSEFIETVIPDLEIEPYDYQLDTFVKCIRFNRALVLSPTASGKSFIIYLIIRFLLENTEEKILISVPSINLVRQMHTDFCAYENNRLICDQCYEMAAGQSKTTSRRVVIATWSMLLRQPLEWFQPYRTFICDEAHQANSIALNKIISNLNHVPYRFGFTGTLDGSKTHELQCRAWFGTLLKSSSTKELMDRGILSTLEVQNISLEYHNDEKQAVSKMNYQEEIKFLVNHSRRNEWIVDLALSQPKNTLVLFNLVEKHGEKLFEIAKKRAAAAGKKVYMIVGEVKVDQREDIRQSMERENNVVLFASFGTLSVGVNIKNLHTIIFAHPYKAKIRTLQSIGRTLRKLSGKECATLIDIVDDLCYARHVNFAYRHAVERMRIYESEEFNSSFHTHHLGQ